GSGAPGYRESAAPAAGAAAGAPVRVWETGAMGRMDECRRCGWLFVSGERWAEGGARVGPVEVAGQAGTSGTAFAARGAAIFLRQDRQDISRTRRAAIPRGDDGGLHC